MKTVICIPSGLLRTRGLLRTHALVFLFTADQLGSNRSDKKYNFSYFYNSDLALILFQG